MFGNLKNITFNKEAKEQLLEGIKLLEETVSLTLGPNGRNVVLERGWGDSRITKDGVTVANDMFIEKDVPNIGMQIMKTISRKTAADAGDGTTTSTILGRYIYELGLQAIEKGISPNQVKRSLDNACTKAVDFIKSKSIEIKGNADAVKQIASISANNDTTVGDLILEAYNKIPDGEIIIENSHNETTFVETNSGAFFDQTYIDTMFYEREVNHTKNYETPYILVSNLKLGNADTRSIMDLISSLNGRSLVIICEELTGNALAQLIFLATEKQYPVVAVKAPSLANMRRLQLEDLATLTGGVFVDRNKDHTLENIIINDLGQAEKIIVTRKNVTITNPAGDKEKIAERKRHIENEIIPNAPSKDLKERHELRLKSLFGGLATIYVGANSEFEQKEAYYRIEDAVCAVKAALEQGVCAGGGTLYYLISKKWSNPSTLGQQILATALKMPITKILRNSGKNENEIASILEEINENNGYNAAKNRFQNLVTQGIIDPTKVLIKALENAVSVAGTLLLSDAVISYSYKETNASVPVTVNKE